MRGDIGARAAVRTLRVGVLVLAAATTLAAQAGGAAGRQGGEGPAGQGGDRRSSAPADGTEVKSLHVQGNVWMLNGGFVNAAVQIGDEGVLVVDTMSEPLADKMLAEIRRLAGDKPIRYVVNTHGHADHTGGNATIAAAGESIVGGNFAGQVGANAANSAQIVAHENVQARMSQTQGTPGAIPFANWPTDTFFNEQKDLYFNGEAVQIFYQPKAHTDGDVMVYFRKSDVLVAGDIFVTTSFPIVDLAQGGSVDGVVATLNRIIDITVPKEKQEGGTYVIPGHGRLTDEADVVEYRDMVTILRDRFRDAAAKGLTVEQVKAARLVRDYEGRYGATQGFWTTDAFIEAAYRSVSQPAASAAKR